MEYDISRYNLPKKVRDVTDKVNAYIEKMRYINKPVDHVTMFANDYEVVDRFIREKVTKQYTLEDFNWKGLAIKKGNPKK